MKRNADPSTRHSQPMALPALQRAAKKAVALARSTGTSAYVLKNGKIIDAARSSPRRRKKP